MKFSDLIGRHKGEQAWIVGKGPSLGYLRKEHFGAGPVIALNQAVLIVERLGITSPIYSLQKDGCGLKAPHEQCLLRDGMDWMIRPKGATLILQENPGYSRHCLADYEPKVFVNPVRDLNFQDQQTMAVRMSIAIAKKMGCSSIAMLCCDSLSNDKIIETFDVHQDKAERTTAGNHYLPAKRHVLRELSEMKHIFVIPKEAMS